MDIIIRKIKTYISNSNIEEAIIEIEKNIVNAFKLFEEEFLSISASYNELKKNYRMGLIDYSIYQRERLKITSWIVELINKIHRININKDAELRKEKLTEKTPFSRTERIALSAKEIFNAGEFGIIRQRSVLSSFTIPNREPNNFVWEERDGDTRAIDFKSLQYEERYWLEKHVMNRYCKLIIKPSILNKIERDKGTLAVYTRLRIFLEFFLANKSKIDIVINEKSSKRNILILGNWFFLQSEKPTIHGYEDTLFNWNKDDVEEQIKKFDDEFESILRDNTTNTYQAKDMVLTILNELLSKIEGRL